MVAGIHTAGPLPTPAPARTVGWVKASDRKPDPYREVPVRLVGGGIERVARLDEGGNWQLAMFKAGQHKYQYIVDVAEWFDERHPMISAAPKLLRVAELLVDWLNEEPGAHKLCDTARAAIALATGREGGAA